MTQRCQHYTKSMVPFVVYMFDSNTKLVNGMPELNKPIMMWETGLEDAIEDMLDITDGDDGIVLGLVTRLYGQARGIYFYNGDVLRSDDVLDIIKRMGGEKDV